MLLVEESDIDETRRDMQYFTSAELCYAFVKKYIADLERYEWAQDLRPPAPPPLSIFTSLDEKNVESIYLFEHQTPKRDFFCIELFVKRV